MDTSFFSKVFPEGLLEHFTITGFLELGNIPRKEIFYEVHLEENNKILGDYDQILYESKDFIEVELQDFPIRGKAVFLKIRRRRWRLKSNKSITLKNDFSHIAVSSGFTNELSDFLKDND